MTTPILQLPELAAGQGDAYLAHNEALRSLEFFAAGVIESRTLTAPPSSPAQGAGYIPAAPATGIWAGKENVLLLYWNNAWRELLPPVGYRVWVIAESLGLVRGASSWVVESANSGGINLDPLPLTDGATIAVDGTRYTFTLTLSGNHVIDNPTTPRDGAVYNFHIQQASTGGLYTPTWGNKYKGTIPALTTNPDGIDWYAFQCIGSDLRFAGKAGPF
jgi:Protein of unknown function (DUF2793)